MAARHINDDIDDIRKDLRRLSDDVGSLFESLRDAGVEQGRRTTARAKGYGGRARSSVQHGGEVALHEIREHPLISILTTLGLGVLIFGLLFSRDD